MAGIGNPRKLRGRYAHRVVRFC